MFSLARALILAAVVAGLGPGAELGRSAGRVRSAALGAAGAGRTAGAGRGEPGAFGRSEAGAFGRSEAGAFGRSEAGTFGRSEAGAFGRTAAAGRGGVTVWLPYWTMAAAYASAIAHAGAIGTASPFWYSIAGDATVVPYPGAGAPAITSGLRARGISVAPTVTETDRLRAFDGVLASARRREAMVRALVSIARNPAYSGLDLDFEQFALDRAHAAAPANAAAAGYASFVGQICGALHAIARTCSVTVMARTSAAHVYWRGKLATWVYDYAALAQAADHVQIMAYDEHAPGTAPGPVAPYPWVQQVVAYARSTMPAGKTELGLAAYGYDFAPSATTSMTAQAAAQLAAQNGVTPGWDAAQEEATYRYGSRRHRHTVWYEDARAEYARARLAAATGFAGVDLWAAGGEDPAVWPLLRGLFGR
jgi:spore germination protein YaaH